MTLTPSLRLYGLAAVMFVALVVCTRLPGGVGAPLYLIALAVASIAYLFAVREIFVTAKFPRRVVVIGLVLSALWHIPFLLMPPGPDDDVHRYLWDGRVQRLGYSPYILVPGDPSVSGLHIPETRTLNNPEVPSPYPAGAQLFFRAVTAIHESIFVFKAAFAACEAAIVILLLAELRRLGRGEQWVLLYAWNPLLVTCVAQSGHVDILGVLLLLLSVAALQRRWRIFRRRRIWIGRRCEVSADCIDAALLASRACSRWIAGGSDRRSAVRTVSTSRIVSHGIAWCVRAAVSF